MLIGFMVAAGCSGTGVTAEIASSALPQAGDVWTMPLSSRPGAITNVVPAERSVERSPRYVAVVFDLLGDGGVDPESIKLILDGQDVTARASGAGTDDNPQSRAQLSVDTGGMLASGLHKVTVRYRSGGQTREYAWEFVVQP